MSRIQRADQTAEITDKHFVLALPTSSSVKADDQVQETIWRLQDDVKRLQQELARTRRALEQRVILLRNAQQRETEFRAEVGVGRRG